MSNVCSVCAGVPLASGRLCICGGKGTYDAEVIGLRMGYLDLERQLADVMTGLVALSPSLANGPRPTTLSEAMRVVTAEYATLIQLHAEIENELAEALSILAPTNPQETLLGAIRNLQQAYISAEGNCETLEAKLAEAQADKASLADVVNTCLREIHINQQASLSDDLRPFVEQLLFHGNQMQRERDALKADLVGREREWQQHVVLCKEAQAQGTRERHEQEAQRDRLIEEVDALKATLAQAEKALAALFFAVGKMGANFPPHPLRAEWEQGRIVLEKMWKDKRDRVGVLDAVGKEAGG